MSLVVNHYGARYARAFILSIFGSAYVQSLFFVDFGSAQSQKKSSDNALRPHADSLLNITEAEAVLQLYLGLYFWHNKFADQHRNLP